MTVLTLFLAAVVSAPVGAIDSDGPVAVETTVEAIEASSISFTCGDCDLEGQGGTNGHSFGDSGFSATCAGFGYSGCHPGFRAGHCFGDDDGHYECDPLEDFDAQEVAKAVFMSDSQLVEAFADRFASVRVNLATRSVQIVDCNGLVATDIPVSETFFASITD